MCPSERGSEVSVCGSAQPMVLSVALNQNFKKTTLLQQADSAETRGLELADLFQLSSDRTGVLSAWPTPV